MLTRHVILYAITTITAITTHFSFNPAAPRLLLITKSTFIIDRTSCGVKLEKMYVVSPVFPLFLKFNENCMSCLDAVHAWKVN